MCIIGIGTHFGLCLIRKGKCGLMRYTSKRRQKQKA